MTHAAMSQRLKHYLTEAGCSINGCVDGSMDECVNEEKGETKETRVELSAQQTPTPF